MKRIGIDGRLMYQTGVGVYIRNLIYYLAQQHIDDLVILIFARAQDIARFTSANKQVCENRQIQFVECEVSWHGFAEQVQFFWQLWQARLDLMHFTYFSWPILYTRPFVATVHDITPLTHETGRLSIQHPRWYRIKHLIFRYVFTAQIKRAQEVITPTRTVAQEVADYFHKDPRQIRSIYEGLSFEFPMQSVNPALAYPYFLYVGNFFPHKNVHALVEAFTKVQDHHGFRLVLVGPENYFSKQLPSHERVILRTDIKQQDLADLYRHANALVFPSLAEGFGLPIVEAMQFGAPLLLSDIAVFREIAGERATYFDPLSIEAIEQTLAQAIGDEAIRQGQRRVYDLTRFSFRSMSEAILAIYRNHVST